MSLLAELKRRNVIRMAGLYLVAAWLITQVASTVLPMFGAPDWLPRTIVVLLAIGFVPALIFAWVYELTPQGLKRDAEVPLGQSIAPQTARRLDRMIIAVLIAALAYFAVDKFVLAPRREASQAAPGIERVGAASAAAAAIPDIDKDPSIAVLPLVNMSSDKEQEYFSDGISEELLNLLAKVPKLRVIARTSSFSFKGRNVPIAEIARALNVATVLEGSVRKAGDKVRITVQLIRATDSTHLWSETYDRSLDDTLAVQLDIAEHVAAALDVILDDSQRARMQESGVKSVDAFVAFQKGRQLYEEAHEGVRSDNLIATLRRAHEEFARATELDPGFAMAYDLGTDLYNHILLSEDATVDERAAALESARRELDLAARFSSDPNERALVAVSRQLLSDDWHGLADRFAEAAARQGCRETNFIRISAAFGFAAARLPIDRKFIACDPLYPTAYQSAAFAALYAEQFEQALQIVADGNRAFGDTPLLAVDEISALAALGRLDAARARLSSLDSGTSAGATGQLIVAAALGEDVRQVSARLRPSRKRETNPEGWALVDMLTEVLAGDRAAANRRAAAIDALPGGSLKLAVFVSRCRCGAPFDLEATPNFRARLAESGLHWPPPKVIRAAAPQRDGRP